MDATAAPFLVPALVRARAPHHPTAGVGTNLHDTWTHTAQGGISIAADLLREVSTVPLARVLGPPSGGVTVYRLGGDPPAMSVVVQDTAVDVAVALEAIQFAQVARARSLPPDLGLGPGLAHVPVLHLTLPPRGTVGAGPGRDPLAEAEGVIAGMTSETADRGHRRDVLNKIPMLVVVTTNEYWYMCHIVYETSYKKYTSIARDGGVFSKEGCIFDIIPNNDRHPIFVGFLLVETRPSCKTQHNWEEH